MSTQKRFFALPPRINPGAPHTPDSLELFKAAQQARADAAAEDAKWSSEELRHIWKNTSD